MGGPAYFSHGTRGSRGVANLVSRNLNFKISSLYDEEGRYVILDFQIDETIYTVGCIYAPTQDRRSEQLTFLEKLDERLTGMTSTNIILGGDLNCCLNAELDKNHLGSSTSTSEPVRLKIVRMMEDWSLCDVWWIRNPKAKSFTF